MEKTCNEEEKEGEQKERHFWSSKWP